MDVSAGAQIMAGLPPTRCTSPLATSLPISRQVQRQTRRRAPMPNEHPPIHVTLLTTPHCGYCEDAKTALTRLAQDYLLAVEVVELGSPAGERLAAQGGVLFPPGLFLDGEPFSYGRVSERKLRRELA